MENPTNAPAKTITESRVEQVHIVLPMNVNGSNQLFGGQLMQWIDIVAAVVARRHSGCQVTTAAVDHLEFLAPAALNDTVVLLGRITYAGRTSMEVCVETYVEPVPPVEGEERRALVNRAYLTMVALDYLNRPTAVPRLRLVTEQEEADYKAAQQRRKERKRSYQPR